MSTKQEPSAVPAESASHTQPPLPTLSQECKRQLAELIANLIETHLRVQDAIDAEGNAKPADQSHSSDNCLNLQQVSIKEDCHAHHGPTFGQD